MKFNESKQIFVFFKKIKQPIKTERKKPVYKNQTKKTTTKCVKTTNKTQTTKTNKKLDRKKKKERQPTLLSPYFFPKLVRLVS